MRALSACMSVVVLFCITSHGLAAWPEPQVEWTAELAGPGSPSPVPYPSGKPDGVVIATGGRVARIDGKGKVVFERAFGPETFRGGLYDASLADLDGDGKEELIVGHNGGYVFGVEADDGEILWEYNLGTTLSTWRCATPADLNGDGRPEILASNMDGWIACLSHDGKLLWRSKVEEYRLTTPTVGDINDDGKPEIVYGSATRHIVALSGTGNLVWDSFLPPLHLGRCKPLIADLDGDGTAEICAMASNVTPDAGLVCVNGADGKQRWTGVTLGKAYRGRSVMKFPDGSLGVVACDKSNMVAAYGADGKLRWRTEVDGRGIWTAPAVADLDGDGAHEIVLTTRDAGRWNGKSWYVISATGKVLGEYSLDGGGFGGPCVADIDQDGVLEIVIASKSGKVTAYTFGGPAKPGAIISSDWRSPAYPLRRQARGEAAPAPAKVELLSKLPSGRFGLNPLNLKLPSGAEKPAVEITTNAPDGTRRIQVFHADKGATSLTASWPVFSPGSYEVTLRLLDLHRNAVLGTQTLKADVADTAAGVAAATEATLGEIGRTRKPIGGSSPDSVVTLARREAEVRDSLIPPAATNSRRTRTRFSRTWRKRANSPH